MSTGKTSAVHVVTEGRADEFFALGQPRRRFFPHRVHRLPKCGPDGFLLAEEMCGIDDPAAMTELVLFADEELLHGLPQELFFDDDVIWHQQQFGLPGQIASASVVLGDDAVTVVTLVSDLVQRIGRRRDLKTQVEKRFDGWRQMLINAVAALAIERGAGELRLASAELAMRHTDAARREGLGAEIFERIYDRAIAELYPVWRDGDWWVASVDELRDKVVLPERQSVPGSGAKTICVCHDIERGLGHRDVKPSFAGEAERTAPAHLARMLEIEGELGVTATYNVVGELLGDVRGEIARGGHAIGFHSYDHRIERHDQLRRCREVDYRLKGYRPPASRVTPELGDKPLLRRNFEWLASSPAPLGASSPELRAGIVRLPIELDDFSLHTGERDWAQWRAKALALADAKAFTAISLHDCYGERWLPHYRDLLERLGSIGELRTLDQVAADVTLAAAL